MSEDPSETRDFVDAFVGSLDQDSGGMSALAPRMPLLFGRYILVRHLASGGMGDVYLAMVRGPGSFRRLVAIKTLRAHLVKERRFVEMFFDEARIAACLIQPNIIQTFDFGIHKGVYYLAMEHVHGLSLSQALSGRPMPLDVSFSLALGAATGLSYAHSAKDQEGRDMAMVHRDIAPKNILVSFTGNLKLMDFGIASAASNSHLTQTGEVKGTINFMPIEQLEGKKANTRWDIYALGLTFYEIFTSKRALDLSQASLAELLDPQKRSISPAIKLNPMLPPALSDIIERCTEIDPEKRYENGSELLVDLRRVAKESAVDQHPDIVAAWLRENFPDEAQRPILSKADWVLAEACDETGVSEPSPRPQDPTGTLAPNGDVSAWTKPTAPNHRHANLNRGKDENSVSQPQSEVETDTALRSVEDSPSNSNTGPADLPTGDSLPTTKRARYAILFVVSLLAVGFASFYWAKMKSDSTQIASTQTNETTDTIKRLPADAAVDSPLRAGRADSSVPASDLANAPTVTIHLLSKPTGATVREGRKLLGTTPLTLQRQKNGKESLRLRLTKKGYRQTLKRIGLAADSRIRIILPAQKKDYRSSDLHR
jgi:serine/threonine protein kinase